MQFGLAQDRGAIPKLGASSSRVPALQFVLPSLLLLLTLGGIGAVRPRSPRTALIVYGGTAACCAVLVLAALVHLLGQGGVWRMPVPVGLPWLRSELVLDALSAVFLLMVNLAGVTASLFGWGYGRAQAGSGHGLEPGRVLPAFPLFLAGMNLVLLASDAFLFLVGWEFMSLTSWLLVLANHREAGNREAGRIYLIMASFGTMVLLLCFGVLAGSAGGYGFDDIRAAPHDPLAAGLAVMLVVLGAGSKAGLAPLHVWLPLAHPAAPSHVSALMSGVMTKVALYALVRVLFDLAGTPDWWWGGVLLALGSATAVLGILYALMQDEMKRLLAYSTVENIGVISVGLGLALVFKADGQQGVAAIAFSAALLHALNHSLYKTLLFYGAGAVLTATGQGGLNRLGGLIHRLPRTAPLVLVGAAAISALPPLNGFASEWLLFQAVLSGPQLGLWEMKVATMVVGVALALAAALTAACFLRFYGIVFLGRPRSPAAAQAREVGPAMLLAMLLPAALCLLVGVLPGSVLALFGDAAAGMVGTPMDSRAGTLAWMWLAPAAPGDGFGGNSYSGLFVLGLTAALTVLLRLLIVRTSDAAVRRGEPWGCGHPDVGPVAQYSGDSFSQPLRRVFAAGVFAARERVDMPEPGEMRPARLEIRSSDPAWTWLIDPLCRAVGWLADKVNGMQFLTIRHYLTLMFGALVFLLTVVAVVK